MRISDWSSDVALPILRPYLGQVEGVEPERLGLRVGHDLDEERPAREVAALDALEEVAAVALAIVGDNGRGLFVGEIGTALLGAAMELHPHALVGGVDHREGVAALAVHVPEAARDAAVVTGDGTLVQHLRNTRPKTPS